MIKIGIISDSIRDRSTGIGYFAKEFTRELIKKYQNFTYIDYQKNRYNRDNLLLIPTKFRFFKTYTWAHILPLSLRKHSFDYIINLTGIPHFFSYRQKEIFFVYDISWRLFPRTHPLSRVLLNWIFFKRTLVLSHKIVTISENTKRDLIKYYLVPATKIDIVYPNFPTITSREICPKIKLPKKYLLYVGTIEPRKNITTLIRSVFLLKKQNHLEYHLVIAGKNGWKWHSIYRLVEQLDLQNDIIFTGYVTDEEKKYLYTHANIFIYLSIYEGFGIPPLEAMYYKCPVITSNISSLPEVVGNAALKINPYDTRSLLKGIIKLSNDSSYRQSIIKHQNLQLKKFLKIHLPQDLLL